MSTSPAVSDHRQKDFFQVIQSDDGVEDNLGYENRAEGNQADLDANADADNDPGMGLRVRDIGGSNVNDDVDGSRDRCRGRNINPNRSSQLRQDLYNLPNLLTYLRVLLIPVFLVVLSKGDSKSSFWAACLFGIASITDFLDGWLARRQNLVSMMGKFLDPLADKLLVTSALIILIPMDRIPAWLVIILLMRELTVTGLRSIASAERMVISAGWAGKVKTGLQFPGLIGLFIHYSYEINFGFFQTTIHFHEVGMALILFSLVFSFWSAGEYFAAFFRQIANHKTTDY